MTATSFSLTKRDKPLRILSTSDWHLGNPRVPAGNICDRLRHYMFPLLEQTDLLNIGGDVWDTLMTLNDETNVIVSFLIDLLRMCHVNNVTVRVLLGTFSHDRDQSSVFEIYQKKCHFTNDLRYISKVYLEEIESLNVRILYLPDDLPYESSEACLEAVSDMMKTRGWTWVDYVFGHGYFQHMLPKNIPREPKCTFRVSQFTPWVRRYILMGHIHLSDQTQNVIYNNSFDRLAHGEEASKGCLYIEDSGDMAKLKIIDNPDATKFVTLDLTKETDPEKVGDLYLSLVKQKFQGIPGYVRVVHPSAEIRQSLHRLTNSRHPELFYSFRQTPHDVVNEARLTVRKSFDVVEYPTPTEHTLPKMVFDYLEANGGSKINPDRITPILNDL